MSSALVYTWREGKRLAGDPQKVGECLEAMRQRYNGYLTPQVVVENARPPASPLHRYFEWDDARAGQKFREYQARWLITSIVVKDENVKSGKPFYAFVNVELKGGKPYTSTTAAMSDDELRCQIVRRALKDLDAWQERYKNLEELAEFFEAIAKVKKRLPWIFKKK